MPGDKFPLFYQIEVDNKGLIQTLNWQINYTVFNSGPAVLGVTPQIQLLVGGDAVGSAVDGDPLDVPAGQGGFGTASGQTSGSATLTKPCSDLDTFSLQLTLEGIKDSCPRLCDLNIDCPDPACYCLYDNLDVNRESAASPKVNSVQGTSAIKLDDTFPIRICESDFASGFSKITLGITSEVMVDTCPFKVSNIARLAVSETEDCLNEFEACALVGQSTAASFEPLCKTPTITGTLTQTCISSICTCKKSIVNPYCGAQDCVSLINTVNKLTDQDAAFSLGGAAAPGVPIDGVTPYINIKVSSQPYVQNEGSNGFAGWCFDIPDHISPDQPYTGTALYLSDPTATGVALEAYYKNPNCNRGDYPTLYVNNLIGILQIFNNAATYENVGYTWQDIQTAIWNLLYGNITSSVGPVPPIPGILPHTDANVVKIINDAIAAQERYNSAVTDDAAAVCAALQPNNGIAGVVLVNDQPCVQIVGFQYSICSLSGVCVPSRTTVDLSPGLPGGELGPVATIGGIEFSGFSLPTTTPGPGTPANLYQKYNAGNPVETGLGLATDGDHEINNKEFVTIKLSSILAAAMSGSKLFITIGSAQNKEGTRFYYHNSAHGSPTDLSKYNTAGSYVNQGDLFTAEFTYAQWSTWDYLAVNAYTNSSNVPNPNILLVSIAYDTCDIIIPTGSIDYSVDFDVDQECTTCLVFNISEYCEGSHNFKYAVTDCDGGLIIAATPFDPSLEVKVCTGLDGIECVKVIVTFTSPAGTPLTFTQTVNLGTPVQSPVFVSDCIDIECAGGCEDCFDGPLLYITLKDQSCSPADQAVINNLLDELFPNRAAGFTINQINAICNSIQVTPDELASLDRCGLNFNLSLPTGDECCGLSLKFTNTVTVTVGDVNTTSSQSLNSVSNVVVVPGCVPEARPLSGKNKPKNNKEVKKNKMPSKAAKNTVSTGKSANSLPSKAVNNTKEIAGKSLGNNQKMSPSIVASKEVGKVIKPVVSKSVNRKY